MGAEANEEFVGRILKFKLNDDLRLCRWPGICSITFPLVTKRLTHGDAFFKTHIALLLQKMLKSIATPKVSLDPAA